MLQIKKVLILIFLPIGLLLTVPAKAEPIYHEVYYPEGSGPFPAVIALHTSGGFKTVKKQIKKYTGAGFAVYAPNFFKRHEITHRNRFDTWTVYRAKIEAELIEIVGLAKRDPKVDGKNVFAVGFSNGGYWATFLAAKNHVNAGASHYGVWAWPERYDFDGYPALYLDKGSNPVLAIHGDNDSVQKPDNVYPELDAAEQRSPKFSKFIFKEAGHSWDGKRSDDGFFQDVTDKALQLTIDLFKKNMK